MSNLIWNCQYCGKPFDKQSSRIGHMKMVHYVPPTQPSGEYEFVGNAELEQRSRYFDELAVKRELRKREAAAANRELDRLAGEPSVRVGIIRTIWRWLW